MENYSGTPIRLSEAGVHLIPDPESPGGYRPVYRETWYTKDSQADSEEICEIVRRVILRSDVFDPKVMRLTKCLKVKNCGDWEETLKDVKAAPVTKILVPGPNLMGLLLEFVERRIPLKGVPWLNRREDPVYYLDKVDYLPGDVELVYSNGSREALFVGGQVQPVYFVPALRPDMEDYWSGSGDGELQAIPLHLLGDPPAWLVSERIGRDIVEAIVKSAPGSGKGRFYGVEYRIESLGGNVHDSYPDADTSLLEELRFWIERVGGSRPETLVADAIEPLCMAPWTSPVTGDTWIVNLDASSLHYVAPNP